ncbi:hypothetical protein HED50_19710 [Ochrobactrum oryzae]|nr:hypothetical protein [Brucella oryzae]
MAECASCNHGHDETAAPQTRLCSPVYFLLKDAQTISGFSEYFQSVSDLQNHALLGITIPVTAKSTRRHMRQCSPEDSKRYKRY